ncbi:hypothetical protein [Methanosarcina barkeri]|uniref:Uncharacterized protein n=1 Tax=Methanosarcina barkeri CM1 TaxID=796385 RepID=A0A0G3C996_METBA|nr:hypothetical protein [Methanosarcina barkeri]AKJ38586.1 hypothetical protein MCM1_1546 [Methanosarcina barkeri CM1]
MVSEVMMVEFGLDNVLHQRIINKCMPLYKDGHFPDAALASMKQVKIALKEKSEDDYRLISKDKTKKMSAITLKYLRDHRIIKAKQYVLYSQISERPEERTMVIEKNVI